ncbi:MAG: hypothetical protein ACYSW8_32760 [Planctomycetota bacterium]|jgi:hypothetical protein
MQTHPDSDSPKMSKALRDLLIPEETDKDTAMQRLANLQRRATDMMTKGEAEITVGKPGERVLAGFIKYGVNVRRMADDPDCLRISVGGIPGLPQSRYLVFRGDPAECLALLERAARALRDGLKKVT